VRPGTPDAALLSAVDDAAGAERVTFGGDEPLAHPAIGAAIRLARERGVRDVDVMTSGVRLAERATELAAAGLRAVVVPLYGPDARTHDAIVGVDGFTRLRAGVAAARAAGLGVRMQTLVLRANLERLRETDRVAREWTGAGLEQAGHVLPRSDDSAEYARTAPRYAEVVRVLAGSRIPLGRFPLCIARQSLPGARGSDPGSNASDPRAFPAPCDGCALRSACPGVPIAMLADGAAGELLPEP